MNDYKQQFSEMAKEEEDMYLKYYDDRIKHLQDELAIRLGLGRDSFKKLEPTFVYENEPAFLDHLMVGLKNTVDYEIAQTISAKNGILRRRLERKEMEELASGKQQ